MAYFNWDEKYSVKVSLIDEQHRKLIDYINELYEAMRSGQGKQVVGKVLNDLIAYTDFHFQAEEQLLEKNGYPVASLLPHKKEHEVFVHKVSEYSQRYSGNGTGLPTEVGGFLKDWLSNHILVVDQKYATFLAGKGVR